jgi:bacillithiol biosynthesis cysteine-adding enzyme BshC
MVTSSEAFCQGATEESGLRVECLPFEKIPHQSKLFLDYLKDPIVLKKFYPNAVRYHHELTSRTDEVLSNYKTDRKELCHALERINRNWGAGEKTLANIEQLRDEKTVAIVTGQQAGLFTGPLYTIYKAMSAVKLACCLTERGVSAVPVFWIATEDHDYDEVATAEFINCNCSLDSVTTSSHIHKPNYSVGSVRFDNSIDETLKDFFALQPDTEFILDLKKIVEDSYQSGKSYGDAFARMMTVLLGQYGLIFLDPLDEKLKKLAAPLYSQAASNAPEIAKVLVARSKELESDGYHAQVLVTEDSFPLFYHTDDGARFALTKTTDDKYKIKDHTEEFTIDELTKLALENPTRFSPNVTLRAVVQDYLLPTIVYFGGAAEIAYFAQTAEAYRLLERPITTILPRASLTMVERHTWRTLNRYDLKLTDLFEGYDNVMTRLVEEHLGTETAKAFDHADKNINEELDRLQEALKKIDPTLADALENGRNKINYQLHGLRSRFHKAQLKRDEAAHRQIERAIAALYPNKALQERHISIVSLLARHGQYVVRWIYDAMSLETNDHQVVYL